MPRCRPHTAPKLPSHQQAYRATESAKPRTRSIQWRHSFCDGMAGCSARIDRSHSPTCQLTARSSVATNAMNAMQCEPTLRGQKLARLDPEHPTEHRTSRSEGSAAPPSMGGIRSRLRKCQGAGTGRTAPPGPPRSGPRHAVAATQASLIDPALGSPVSLIQRTSSTCIFRLALRAALSSMRLRVSPGSLARS